MLPEEEIRAEPWYGEAVERPNTVVLGGYDTSRVRLTGNIQKGNQLVVATALATDLATDKSGEIDVVTFFTISQISDVLAAQNRDGDMGFSVILDGSGQVIYGDMGREAVRDFFGQRLGEFPPGSQTRRAALLEEGNCDYFFRTRAIPDTDWSVVTFTKEASLPELYASPADLAAGGGKFHYRQFLSTLPVSLDESALLDGCSYFQLFARIIFPLLAPATATVAIIKAITIINDMYIPYLYMPKSKLRTLTTFLMDYANAQQGSWQTLAAGIIVVMLPTILVYLFFQRYILAGVAAGAVKE